MITCAVIHDVRAVIYHDGFMAEVIHVQGKDITF